MQPNDDDEQVAGNIMNKIKIFPGSRGNIKTANVAPPPRRMQNNDDDAPR
jgi:hypothetical protein